VFKSLLVPGNAIELRESNLIKQILCRQKVNAMAGLRCSHSKTDREMRLADAWRTEKNNVLGTANERKSLQGIDDFAIDRNLSVEVE